MPVSDILEYSPNKTAAIAFAVLYGIAAFYHEYQISKTKPQRFTTPLSLGGFMSMAGFITRYVAINKEKNYLVTWVVSQVLILGAGPTYAGADYFVAARLFHFVPHAAPLRPARVVSTFLTFDILAELLLYVGAIMALQAKGETAKEAGLWILRMAMCIQVMLFLVFVLVVMKFHAAVERKGLKGNWRRIITTLYVSSVLIVTRSVYHIAETFVPHSSPLRSKEIYFLIFEGGIMFVNVAMFNLIHPGFLLPPRSTTYLQEDGTLTDGNDYQDTRPIAMRIFDPFDFRGMMKRRDEKIVELQETEMQRLAQGTEMHRLTKAGGGERHPRFDSR